MDKKIEIQLKRRTNLDDEIYFLTYAMPLYKDEISLRLYNEKGHPTVIRKIKELEKKNWVNISKIDDLPKYHKEWVIENLDENDKRYRLRKYVYANPDIVFLRICEIIKSHGENYALSVDEEKQLKKYLTSDVFMNTIQRFLLFKFWREDISIKDIFSTFVNIILMDAVFHTEMINLYIFSIWESQIYTNVVIYTGNLDENKMSNNLYNEINENYDKYKDLFFVDLNPSLAKKLFCLNFQFADSLRSYFEIYRLSTYQIILFLEQLNTKQRKNPDMEITFKTFLDIKNSLIPIGINPLDILKDKIDYGLFKKHFKN